MQYQHIGYGIRGFYRAARLGNLAGMNTHAQHRLKVLDFLDRHGLAATCEAFAVSRRTLYRWKAALRQAGGNPTALVPRSSAPRTRRAPHWPTALVEQIRHLRTEYPNLGKAKVHALLADWCRQHAIPLPSVSTIGRIIAKDPHQMRHAPTRLSHKGRRKPVRRNRKNRQPKGQKHPPLSVFACDTVIRVRDGIRRYLFTFIDPNSRFAIAFAARSPSSRQATFALEALCQLLPTPPPPPRALYSPTMAPSSKASSRTNSSNTASRTGGLTPVPPK